jgi:hypothetical protein
MGYESQQFIVAHMGYMAKISHTDQHDFYATKDIRQCSGRGLENNIGYK